MHQLTRSYSGCATAIAIATATLIGGSGAAMAQAWPAKTISIIVPFATGGTTDAIARTLGQELSRGLGQPVIIENKPGAGATIGADYVAKARPDGYVLLMGAVHHTIATSVYKKLPYDFQRDLAPVSTIAIVPNVLVVNPKLPAKNIAELVALAKKSPGKLTFGSNGNGTGQHLIGAQFNIGSGVDILHVPYKGSGPLTIDLLGGQIDMSFDTVTPVLSHIRAGKLRALAVTTIQRSAALPDVPTLDEAGLKGFDQGTWFGILAPAATPRDVVTRLNNEVIKVVSSPEFRKKMSDIGAVPVGNTAAQMAAQIKTDTERYAKLVKDANVTIQ
jgi:tripartite-type tricarboxylate transporter receptor subunit TctC